VDYIEAHGTGTKVSLLILGRYIMTWNDKLFEDLLMAAFFKFTAVVSFQGLLANSDFWLVTTNLLSKSFFSSGSQKTWIIHYNTMKISEIVCSLFFFLTGPKNFSLDWILSSFLSVRIRISALYIRVVHSLAHFTDSIWHYLQMVTFLYNVKVPWYYRELCYCGTFLSYWYHFCGNVSQCAHNSSHSENLSVLECDALPLCKQFMLFWKFLSPSEWWEPPMQRHSVNDLKDLTSHECFCENLRLGVIMLHVHMCRALLRPHFATCTEWC